MGARRLPGPPQREQRLPGLPRREQQQQEAQSQQKALERRPKMVTTRQREKKVGNSAKTTTAKKKKEKAKVARVAREKAQVAKAKAAAKVTAENNARRAGPVRPPRPKPVLRTSPRRKTPTPRNTAMIAAANFAQGISDDAEGKPKIRSFKFVRPN
jgi:hypothetical protein